MFPFLSDHWSHLSPFPSVSTQPHQSVHHPPDSRPNILNSFVSGLGTPAQVCIYTHYVFLPDILRLAHARVQVLLYFSITVIIIALLVPVNEVMRKPGQWTQWTVGAVTARWQLSGAAAGESNIFFFKTGESNIVPTPPQHCQHELQHGPLQLRRGGGDEGEPAGPEHPRLPDHHRGAGAGLAAAGGQEAGHQHHLQRREDRHLHGLLEDPEHPGQAGLQGGGPERGRGQDWAVWVREDNSVDTGTWSLVICVSTLFLQFHIWGWQSDDRRCVDNLKLTFTFDWVCDVWC